MTPSEALSIISYAMPGDITPVEGNPNIMGWHSFRVFFRGSTSYVSVDSEGNLIHTDPTHDPMGRL